MFIPGINKIADHPLVKRLMGGIFNKCPTKPRYNLTWDTSTVINFLITLTNEYVSPKMLSYKVAASLTILSGQRVSTVHKLKISQLHISEDIAIFTIPELLKHTKQGNLNKPLVYHKYLHDDQLCPVSLSRHYIAYRDTILSDSPDELIVTYGKSYHPASKDTLARWIKDLLSSNGIDTSIFKPHSCRSASTSKVSSSGIAIEHILKSGQWKSSSTFYQFYCRNITWTDFSENVEFANSTLEV